MGSALTLIVVSGAVGVIAFITGWLFGRTHASEETIALSEQVQHLAELAEERRERLDAIQTQLEKEDSARPSDTVASVVDRLFR